MDRPHRTVRLLVTALVLAIASAVLLAAEKVTLEKSVPVTGKKCDKSSFGGRVVAYDDAGFDLRGKSGEVETIPWRDLDAKTHFAVRKNLIDPKDAEAQLALGRELLAVEGGKEYSEKAFAAALKLDPKLKTSVDGIRRNASVTNKPGPSTPTTKGGAGESSDSGGGMKPSESGGGGGGTGPKTIGELQKSFWGKQSDEQQAAAVDQLKRFADETQKRMGKKLSLNETKYFLFYSDLPDQEARNWSGLLDRMYDKLANMFAVAKNTNIWRGKGLVFVFRSQSDYYRFEALMHRTDAKGSAGMCNQFGDGMVHIAFYRQEQELEFAHVLVHESSHGFLHRYRSPVPVPSWANEGLAEWIATTLLEDKRPNQRKEVQYAAGYFIRQHKGIGTLFTADHVEGWHYPISEMLTTFMIERNPRGYVAFINGIKDGVSWEESLKKNMRYTKEQLILDFAAAMKIK
jgi:hypothetical protein